MRVWFWQGEIPPELDPSLVRRRRKRTDFSCERERMEWRRAQNREAKRRYRCACACVCERDCICMVSLLFIHMACEFLGFFSVVIRNGKRRHRFACVCAYSFMCVYGFATLFASFMVSPCHYYALPVVTWTLWMCRMKSKSEGKLCTSVWWYLTCASWLCCLKPTSKGNVGTADSWSEMPTQDQFKHVVVQYDSLSVEIGVDQGDCAERRILVRGRKGRLALLICEYSMCAFDLWSVRLILSCAGDSNERKKKSCYERTMKQTGPGFVLMTAFVRMRRLLWWPENVMHRKNASPVLTDWKNFNQYLNQGMMRAKIGRLALRILMSTMRMKNRWGLAEPDPDAWKKWEDGSDQTDKKKIALFQLHQKYASDIHQKYVVKERACLIRLEACTFLFLTNILRTRTNSRSVKDWNWIRAYYTQYGFFVVYWIAQKKSKNWTHLTGLLTQRCSAKDLCCLRELQSIAWGVCHLILTIRQILSGFLKFCWL